MFEKATRQKLRFTTIRGEVSTEDLWDIPLTGKKGFNLDEIAKTLNRAIKDAEEESFVTPVTKSNETLKLKFELVKHIIKTKLEERDLRIQEADKAAHKARILSLIAEKQDDALRGKSLEELEKELENL